MRCQFVPLGGHRHIPACANDCTVLQVLQLPLRKASSRNSGAQELSFAYVVGSKSGIKAQHG